MKGHERKRTRPARECANRVTPAGLMFRRNSQGGYITFHMGDLFDQYPKLQPEYDIEAPTVLTKDEKGRPFLSINIKGGIVNVVRRSGGRLRLRLRPRIKKTPPTTNSRYTKRNAKATGGRCVQRSPLFAR